MFATQEEKDGYAINWYTQRFHVSWEDIRTNRCYLSEEEGKYQSYDKTQLRGKPADPEFMRRDLFERLAKQNYENRRQISLSGGYAGSGAVPAYKYDEENKRYEEEKKWAEEICRKYKEEVYPNELKDFEEKLEAIYEKNRQANLERVRRDDYYHSYFERRREKEKIRQELEDPEWERLQLEKERKVLAIRRQAEREAGLSQQPRFYADNQQTYEKEKWMKMTMMNTPENQRVSIDELYEKVFGKKAGSN